MTDKDIADLEQFLGDSLDPAYKEFLASGRGLQRDDGLTVYSSLDEIKERNETFQVRQYLPGYFAIGDDSGGNLIVAAVDQRRSRIFLVDSGGLDDEMLEPLSNGFAEWAAAGFPRRRS
jgi:hypothetical protein